MDVFINETLANASVGDTIHDFGSNIDRLFESLKSDKTTMAQYCQGIPVCYDKNFDINNEASILASMVREKSYTDGGRNMNIDYTKTGEKYYVAPFNTPKEKSKEKMLKIMQTKLKEEHLDEYEITTINGVKYSVTGSTVVEKFQTSIIQSIKKAAGFDDDSDKRVMIKAGEFVKKFGIEDNSVLVVDFAAVSIMSILKNGPQLNTRIFYAMTPEVENDPAPKLSIDDEVFYEKTGVELVSVYQNDAAGIVHPYTYSVANEEKYKSSIETLIPGENFYTNYIFYLSGLIPRKDKAAKFTTDIKVSHPEKQNLYTSTISNSKIQNSINNATQDILAVLGIKKPSESDVFRMNAKYQLKRSGDWLQVLACMNLHSKNIVGYSNKKYSEKDLGSVYFVTHDRIALAFALLNGINCIYTHAASFSCYVFKANDATKERNMNIVKVGNILTEYVEVYPKNKKQIDETYPKYMQFYNKSVNEWQEKLEEKCKTMRETLYSGDSLKEFNISGFDKMVHELFETTYIYNAVMFVYSNLKANYEHYVEQREKMAKSLVGINRDNLNDLPNEKMNEIIDLYRKYMDANSAIFLCLESGDNSVAPYIVNIDKAVEEIKKNKYYKSIRSWKWDISISSRVINTVEALSNIKPMDQNEFLYHLKRLDQKSIVSIIRSFEPLYRVLRNTEILMNYARETVRGKLTATSIKRVEKFMNVALPFTVEVFISIGDLVRDETLDEKLREMVDRELCNAEPSSVLTDAAIVQENTVGLQLAELDVASALLLLSKQAFFSPMTMSVSKSIQKTYGGATAPQNQTLFLEHNLREMTYPLMSRLLSIDVKKSPAFYDFVHHTMISVAGIEALSPIEHHSEELGEAYGKIQVLYNWLKKQKISRENDAMVKMLDVLLETGEKRKRSLSQGTPAAAAPTKRRRIMGGGGDGKRPNIYRDNHACFHPLFPIYVMCESLYQMSFSLENESSLDNVPFFQHINFMAKLMNGVIEHMEGPLEQLKAAYFGLALREMLLTTNMYLYTDIYTKTMKMSREQYLQIQLMNSVLSSSFVNMEKSREGVFLRFPLFRDFLASLDLYEVVETTPNTTVEKARAKIRKMMEKMTMQIISDRSTSMEMPHKKAVSAPMVAAVSAKMGLIEKKTSHKKRPSRASSGKITRKVSNKGTPPAKKVSAAYAKVSPQQMVFAKRKRSRSANTGSTSGRTRKQVDKKPTPAPAQVQA